VPVQNSREKRKFAEVKSLEQSTENKDKASPSASQSQTKESNKPPTIMITGGENHQNLTSITKQAIGDEHYQTKLRNDYVNASITRIES
jgi:hypothetical protein